MSSAKTKSKLGQAKTLKTSGRDKSITLEAFTSDTNGMAESANGFDDKKSTLLANAPSQKSRANNGAAKSRLLVVIDMLNDDECSVNTRKLAVKHLEDVYKML